MTLLLGIDTGGTFTDAVLYDEAALGDGVVAAAKALTTRENLAVGVSAAMDKVLAAGRTEPLEVGLVCLSTTLATNALVEGRGSRAGLVLIGFDPGALDRAGLRQALADDPHIIVEGGHNSFGEAICALDLPALARAVRTIAAGVSGFAIAAHFAVRNPEHERQARDLIRAETGLPITCSHELSSKLDGPKRALTALLNARLVGIIDRLISSTQSALQARGIAAPLMVVRGDGSLINAATAHERPIETILSGPAASVIGARHLTGLDNAVISDIGGTTTDIAIVEGGRLQVDPMGALVGGWRTMVEAVAMRTHGLGGDSEVSLVEAGSGASIGLGPRRVVPVCLLAGQHGELVHAALDRQARLDQAGDMHGRFVVPMRAASRLPAGLTKAQAAILEELGTDPVPLDTIARSSITKAALIRLAALGHVMFAALTPTDAAHVLGLHAEFDAKAARKAAELFARRSDARGERIAADGGAVSQLIVETLVRRSAEAILDAALAQDGFLEPALSRTTLAQAALTRHSRSVAVQMALTIPLVGVGASAATYYPAIAARLGAECVVPRHAEVANAIGTVVGHIEMSAEVTISQGEDGTFLVQGLKAPERATSLPEAFELAENAARAEAAAKARAAGADEIEIRVHREENTAVIDGRPFFLEAVLRATATGRPRIKSL